MIVKKMQDKAPNKAKSRHVSDILDYITAAISEIAEDKILWTDSINMVSTDYEDMKTEMQTLASTTRSRNPIDHIIFSFRREDKDTIRPEQVRDAVTMFLDDLGYAGCQTVYAVHADTDNTHVHMCVNRTDPDTHILRSNSYDVEKMHKSIARIGDKYNWTSEEHARYVVVDNEVTRAKYITTTDEITITDAARSYELRQGEKSMQRVAAENIVPILDTSKSWPELHSRLALHGFTYVKKGGGAILKVIVDGKTIEIKPSTVAKWASLKNMEKRLGGYTDSTVTVAPRQPEPMPGVSPEILHDYRSKKNEVQNAQQIIYEKFEKDKEQLKSERRAMLDAITAPGDWGQKELALAALHKVASEYHKEQWVSLKERFKEKLEHEKRINPSVTNFEVWIKDHKPEQATEILATIERTPARIAIPAHTHPTEDDQRKQAAFEQYHNAVQADRYRVSSRGVLTDPTTGEQKKVCLILDADRITKVSEGYTPEQVVAALPRMSQYERRGEHIYYTPLSESKHHFFVDDLTVQSLEKMKQDGLRPACIIESSPGNFQAIFTIPKLGTAHDKQIANDVAQGINLRYGDVCFSGAIHPHRAPGYRNTKPEHKMAQGYYPTVRIIEATGAQCPKLQAYARYVDGYLDYQQAQAQQRHKPAQAQQQRVHVGSHADMKEGQGITLYMAHRAAVIRYAGVPERSLDGSRVDAMVAIRLRATGHTAADVADIIATAGRAMRGDDAHDWLDYAQRTTDYAFGPVGDAEISRYNRYLKQWRSLEDSATGKIQIKAILSPNDQKNEEKEIQTQQIQQHKTRRRIIR